MLTPKGRPKSGNGHFVLNYFLAFLATFATVGITSATFVATSITTKHPHTATLCPRSKLCSGENCDGSRRGAAGSIGGVSHPKVLSSWLSSLLGVVNGGNGEKYVDNGWCCEVGRVGDHRAKHCDQSCEEYDDRDLYCDAHNNYYYNCGPNNDLNVDYNDNKDGDIRQLTTNSETAEQLSICDVPLTPALLQSLQSMSLPQRQHLKSRSQDASTIRGGITHFFLWLRDHMWTHKYLKIILVIIEIVFSSTFLTILLIFLIINPDFRRVTFLFASWLLWLIFSAIFHTLRLATGLYHILRIEFDLLIFVLATAISRLFLGLQCAKGVFKRDTKEILLAGLDKSTSYEEWVALSSSLDDLTDASAWRLDPASDLYEWQLLQSHTQRLKRARKDNDWRVLMLLLEYSCSRDFCNLQAPELYAHSRVGTKYCVEEFMTEVSESLRAVCAAPFEGSPIPSRGRLSRCNKIVKDKSGSQNVNIGFPGNTERDSVERVEKRSMSEGDDKSVSAASQENHVASEATPTAPGSGNGVSGGGGGATGGMETDDNSECDSTLASKSAPMNVNCNDLPREVITAGDVVGVNMYGNGFSDVRGGGLGSLFNRSAMLPHSGRSLLCPSCRSTLWCPNCAASSGSCSSGRGTIAKAKAAFASHTTRNSVNDAHATAEYSFDNKIRNEMKFNMEFNRTVLRKKGRYHTTIPSVPMRNSWKNFLENEFPPFFASLDELETSLPEIRHSTSSILHNTSFPASLPATPKPNFSLPPLVQPYTPEHHWGTATAVAASPVVPLATFSASPAERETHSIANPDQSKGSKPFQYLRFDPPIHSSEIPQLTLNSPPLPSSSNPQSVSTQFLRPQRTPLLSAHQPPETSNQLDDAAVQQTMTNGATKSVKAALLEASPVALSSPIVPSYRGLRTPFLTVTPFSSESSTSTLCIQTDTSLCCLDNEDVDGNPPYSDEKWNLGGYDNTTQKETPHRPCSVTGNMTRFRPPPAPACSKDSEDMQYICTPQIGGMPTAAKNNDIFHDGPDSCIRTNPLTSPETSSSGSDAPTTQRSMGDRTKSAVHKAESSIDVCEKNRSFRKDVSIDELKEFFANLRLSLGRTALCLSGGGSLAMYHCGVVKALASHRLLPRVISGSSGGAIVAGQLAIHTDKEMLSEVIKEDISNRYGVRWFPPFTEQIKRFFSKGQMLDPEMFQHTCSKYYGEWTFGEALQRTGRLVSITVSPASRHGVPVILNCVNTPHVLIRSAVAASCALPGLMEPVQIYAKDAHGHVVPYFPNGLKWMDGSINMDIPHKELSSLFNVKTFIVSQVNPHHAPFVSTHTPGWRFTRSLENWLTLDIKSRYAVLASFNMVPKIFGQNISNFWMIQRYEGNVTITPRASILDWYRMITQPSQEDMKWFIQHGESRTWPSISRIAHILKIEQTLRECWGYLCLNSTEHKRADR